MKKDTEDKALEAVAKHLETLGWKCLVIGFKHVEQLSDYKFRVSLDFTGAKKK